MPPQVSVGQISRAMIRRLAGAAARQAQGGATLQAVGSHRQMMGQGTLGDGNKQPLVRCGE